MNDFVACQHCDFLMSKPVLKEGECALCPRCKHKITRRYHNGVNRLLAFTVTSLILLFLTTQFDILTFNLSGNMSQLDVFNSANTLYFDDYKVLAVLIFFFILLLPAAILVTIALFVLSLKTGIGKWAQTSLLRIVFFMMPWAMVEVFLVSILVSLVKLVTIAQMELGMSFWAYAIFCFSYVKVLSLIDQYQCWHWIDEAS